MICEDRKNIFRIESESIIHRRMKYLKTYEEKQGITFNEWLKSWDFKINSVDNRDSLEIAVNQCKGILNLSSKICNDIERKYIKSALNGKLEGSNEYNEAYVKAIEKAESIETHKELKKINSLAFSLMYYIENLNELKNIRTKENFKLRDEIAKLKNGRTS